MYLYFMRHGKAEEESAEMGLKENLDRALTVEGASNINEIACGMEHIFKKEKLPVCLYSSAAKRCWQTAIVVANHWEHRPEVEIEEAFDDGTEIEGMMRAVSKYGPMPTMVVGHHPSIKEMIGRLIGARGSVNIHFSHGGIAQLEFLDDRVDAGKGILKKIYNPWIMKQFS